VVLFFVSSRRLCERASRLSFSFSRSRGGAALPFSSKPNQTNQNQNQTQNNQCRTSTKSAVRYEGVDRRRIRRLFWSRDPFTSALHAPWNVVVAACFLSYFLSFGVWASFYWLAWKYDGKCFIGIQSAVSAFLFAIETQQTIGE
jgi:hypothetical protein